MTFFEIILWLFIFSGAWVAIIAFLGKSLISNLLAKDLERLKGAIAAKNIEKQVVLARLHEQRAHAVSEIYQGLIKYTSTCRKFVHSAEHADEDGRQELLGELSTSAEEFRSTFQINKLYLRKELCEKIEAVFKKAQVPTFNFIFALGSYVGENISKDVFHKEWVKAFEMFADNMPPLLEELEDEFRELLGVNE